MAKVNISILVLLEPTDSDSSLLGQKLHSDCPPYNILFKQDFSFKHIYDTDG